MNGPNHDELLAAIDALARAMSCPCLPKEQAMKIIEHVLYADVLFGTEGKQGWACCLDKLITERELRNLLMAHCATNIARWHEVDEPSSNMYESKELCDLFEKALWGRMAELDPIDVPDPWE